MDQLGWSTSSPALDMSSQAKVSSLECYHSDSESEVVKDFWQWHRSILCKIINHLLSFQPTKDRFSFTIHFSLHLRFQPWWRKEEKNCQSRSELWWKKKSAFGLRAIQNADANFLGQLGYSKTLKAKVRYSLTSVAQTSMMTSAKLAFVLIEEKLFCLLKMS